MHQIRIIDGPGLRWVLGEMRKRWGSERKAAKALGIGQTVFTRLRTGKVWRSMRVDTYHKIRDALKGIDFEFWDIFGASVLTAEGSLVLRQYEKWLRAEYDRLEPKVGSVFTELWGHQDYRPLFEAFLKEVTKGTKPSRVAPARRRSAQEHYDLGPVGPVQRVGGIDIHRVGGIGDGQASVALPGREGLRNQRVWIALFGAVEPLGGAQLTWGVERTWREMHEAGDLGSFLRAALKREEIMLDRERDYARLNQCRPPDEYLEWLAGPEEEGARYMPAAELLEGLEGEGGEGEGSE